MSKNDHIRRTVAIIGVRENPCIYCNGRHSSHRCNNREILMLIPRMEYCMGFDECPQFDKFPINQLRYIADYFVLFKHAMPTLGTCIWFRTRGNKYNRKYGLDPIPHTTKTRMVKALVERWNGFAQFRIDKAANQANHHDDCPICTEHMVSYHWKDEYARSALVYCESTNSRGELVFPTRTKCNHMFCGSCWDMFIQTNTKERGYVNHVWDDSKYVACPLCRTEILVKD
jgi:hypothetical protein